MWSNTERKEGLKMTHRSVARGRQIRCVGSDCFSILPRAGGNFLAPTLRTDVCFQNATAFSSVQTAYLLIQKGDLGHRAHNIYSTGPVELEWIYHNQSTFNFHIPDWLERQIISQMPLQVYWSVMKKQKSHLCLKLWWNDRPHVIERH